MKPIKESSEVQSIQLGDGDVMRNIAIPIYMVFPRWLVPYSMINNYEH